MPLLVVEQAGKRHAGKLSGRLLIGRASATDLVIRHPAVSRLHAWIERDGADYRITDAGSRTGTLVNGQPIDHQHRLKQGDVIQIGPARIVFQQDDKVPPNAWMTQFVARSRGSDRRRGGILFKCVCGAPLWTAAKFGGGVGQCQHCEQMITIPKKWGDEAAIAKPRRSAPQRKAIETCSICQTAFAGEESHTHCPDCGLTFHADCWTENRGCSAYGCSQVNALETELDVEIDPAEEVKPPPVPLDLLPEANHEMSAYLYLALAGAGALFGALLYGIPSLLIGILTVRRLVYGSYHGTTRIYLSAIAICFVGVAGGMPLSFFWWSGWSGWFGL